MSNSQSIRNTRGPTKKALEQVVDVMKEKPDVIHHAELYINARGEPILYTCYRKENNSVEAEYRYNGKTWVETSIAYWSLSKSDV